MTVIVMIIMTIIIINSNNINNSITIPLKNEKEIREVIPLYLISLKCKLLCNARLKTHF